MPAASAEALLSFPTSRCAPGPSHHHRGMQRTWLASVPVALFLLAPSSQPAVPSPPADNDAPGDALAEELARRLGRERCWRVRWPLNEEDHQYAAELAGVDYVRHDEPTEAEGVDSAASDSQAAAEALDADAAAALAALPDGSEAVSAMPAEQAAAEAQQAADQQQQQQQQAPASEALQLAVQAMYYRKDANEVLMKDGPAMLRAFLDTAEPFPIRGLLR